MNRLGKLQGIKLIAKFIIFLALLVGCFVLLTALLHGGLKSPAFPKSINATEALLHPEIHLGELAEPNEQNNWEPLESALGTSATKAYKGIYWIRMTYRDLPVEAPRLWIRGIQHYEVFVNGQSKLEFNMDRMNPKVNTQRQFRLIPLPEEGTILMRIATPKTGFSLIPNSILIAEADQAFSHILRQNGVKVILGIVFSFMAAACLFAYLTNRRTPLFLFLSLMSLGQGFGCLINSETFNYYIDTSAAMYYYPLVWPFSMVAYLAFLEGLYGAGFGSLIRRGRQFMLVYFLACAVSPWIGHEAYLWLTGQNYQILLVAVLIGVSLAITRTVRAKADGKIEWVLFGNAVIILLWVYRWLLTESPRLEEWVYVHFPIYSFYWQPNIAYIAGFTFILCTARVLASHLGDMQKQLAKLNEGLEEQVRERTTELENANVQLRDSLREKYEALGEIQLLEERNRISQEIHDILGHKLVGTIIQMEAARRLMEKDPDTAQSKLDAALDSVRRGLSDVRTTVRLMKFDFTDRDLVAKLDELMSETEKMTGVTIERRIPPLPAIDTKQKKLIYHALQEGLTNGIKHGGCRRFYFSLSAEGNGLEFLLYNDGTPVSAAPHGFGLSSMHERIHHLGGSVELSPSSDVLTGSVLAIRMPLILCSVE